MNERQRELLSESIKLISAMIGFSKASSGFGIYDICSISSMLNIDPWPVVG